MSAFSSESQKEGTGRRLPLRYRLAFQCAALLIVGSIALAAASWLSWNKASAVHAASWNQIFDEEFNGPAGSGVNTSVWQYDTGQGIWGTGEVEDMTSSTTNVSLDGQGHLKITPVRDASGNWTSGRIETIQDNFGAPAGGELEITASIQQPNVSGSAALGYWPAFWTLGTPYRTDHNWPKDGEVDILEDVNGMSDVYGTLHCGTDPGGPCNEPNGIGSGAHACPGCQTGFHTYTEIIDRSVSPEQIRWYLDGANYFTVSANQVDATTWANAVDHPFFVILDVAMGGGFPNGVSGTTTPTSATQSGVPMLVDYVRVYTSGGSTPTPTPTPSCTSGNYTDGVNSTGSSTALAWFQPCGWTAGYVILHYIAGSNVQQNVYMSYNSGAGQWQYTVSGMSSGEALQYSFTYQKNGLQYDTAWSTWTHP
jgi:hypothetical protein